MRPATMSAASSGSADSGSVRAMLARCALSSRPASRSQARSRREFQALWDMRDGCAEFVRTLDHIASGDISVPVARIPDFLRESQAGLREIDPATVFLAFGHMGDGNLHYVFCTPQKAPAMDRLLRMVAAYGASISAEHGIGVDKKAWLHLSRSTAEIATLRALKATLDPRGILNSGRIFDPL